MAIGSWSISTDNPLMDSVTPEMLISLDDGLHLEIRPLNMSTSRMFVVRVLTPDQPYWQNLCAAETATLALMEASRIVGAMDRIP